MDTVTIFLTFVILYNLLYGYSLFPMWPFVAYVTSSALQHLNRQPE